MIVSTFGIHHTTWQQGSCCQFSVKEGMHAWLKWGELSSYRLEVSKSDYLAPSGRVVRHQFELFVYIYIS